MLSVPSGVWQHFDVLLSAQAIVQLFAIEVSASECVFITNHRTPPGIVHHGVIYQPFPVARSSFEVSGEGDLPSATLTVTNIGRLPMPFLEAGDFHQRRVLETIVLPGDPVVDTGIQFEWTTQSASATDKQVSLELGQPNFYERPFPPERFLRASGFPGIPRNPN